MRFILFTVFSVMAIIMSNFVNASQTAQNAQAVQEKEEGEELGATWDLDLDDNELDVASIRDSLKHQYVADNSEKPRDLSQTNKNEFYEDSEDDK